MFINVNISKITTAYAELLGLRQCYPIKYNHVYLEDFVRPGFDGENIGQQMRVLCRQQERL